MFNSHNNGNMIFNANINYPFLLPNIINVVHINNMNNINNIYSINNINIIHYRQIILFHLNQKENQVNQNLQFSIIYEVNEEEEEEDENVNDLRNEKKE